MSQFGYPPSKCRKSYPIFIPLITPSTIDRRAQIQAQDTALSLPMKHKKPNLRIHLPPPRMALILNLIVRSQMPLAVPLTAPKRIITARIRRLNASWIVRASLGRNTPILHLYVFARSSMGTCRCWCRRDSGATSHVAVGHMVRCRGSRRAGTRWVAYAWVV
jgi:hypothetical protein